ncbi:YidC/Oxa1 family membrane protein insertase [Streptomyces sp. NPDC001594]|uniref:YidC/Oxa1 family membrane protein insertase n=1 Tax=Streptomyces sp. NPDC001594 TaxID=3364590 RepID=UPI0036C5B10E
MSVYGAFAAAVAWVAGRLEWVFAESATAAAIVVITALIRGVLHPLNRSVFRAERTRAALAPRLSELRRRHEDRPRTARRQAVRELYLEAGTSPRAGILPVFAQLPVFFVMHEVFSRQELDGEPNGLLDEVLFGSPLGGRWADALSNGGPLGRRSLVFLGLFAAIALGARWSVVRARRAAAAGFGPTLPAEDEPGAAMLRRIAPLLPLVAFGTLVMAAYVPLAAGLYLLASMVWTTAERAWLLRCWTRTTGGAAAGTVGGRSGTGGRRRRGLGLGRGGERGRGHRRRGRPHPPTPGRHRRQPAGTGRHRRAAAGRAGPMPQERTSHAERHVRPRGNTGRGHHREGPGGDVPPVDRGLRVP